MKKNRINLLIKLLFSFGLLGILVYKTNMSLLWESIKEITITTIIVSICVFFIAHIINSVKWHILLPQYRIMFLFKLNMISVFYSLLLPGQIAGDIMKAYKLGKGQGDAERIAASVMVDKITGTIGVLFVAFLGFILTAEYAFSFSFSLILLSCLLLCMIMLLLIRFDFLYILFRNYLAGIPNRRKRFAVFTSKLILFIDALHVYTKKSFILFINVLVGILFQIVAVFISFFIANDLDLLLPFFDWCWIYGIVSIALLLPITIGGLGVREGSLIGILGWLGFGSDKAMALSILIFGLQIIGALLGGFFEFSFKRDTARKREGKT